MKWIRRLLCLPLLLLFLLPARAEEIDSLRQSVVHLYAIGESSVDHTRSRWTGSAFAVGPAGEDSDIFLTNWHVATGTGKYTSDEVTIWLLFDDAQFDSDLAPLPGSAVECEVLATTTGYPDVAVIRAKEPVPGHKALPLLSSWQVPDQTPVYALGFPGLQATHYGADSGPEDVAVTSGIVTDHLVMTRAGNSRALVHTAPIRHGNSGGPLVNADGVVVAQNTYGFEEDASSGRFVAVYIDYGMKLLDDLGIPYTTVSGPSRITVLIANLLHKPGISPAAAMAVFVLMLLAAAAFILYFLKTAGEAWKEVREKFRK